MSPYSQWPSASLIPFWVQISYIHPNKLLLKKNDMQSNPVITTWVYATPRL